MNPSEHALAALLWSETDDAGTALDRGDYKVSESLKTRVTADWNRFREIAEAIGFDPDEHRAMTLHPDCEGNAWNAAAHDFILTRNCHGDGFWDTGRWGQPWASILTNLAHSFGGLNCYVGDDGAIYGD
jgi:hypothetical protein